MNTPASKTVLAFGTYDLLHPGHEFVLSRAAELGDKLVVVVARDANVEQIKGFRPEHSEEERRAAVESLPYVTEARLGYEEWGRHLDVLEDVQPDVIVLGYDQKGSIPEGPWEVVRMEAHKPEQYKSSLLRNKKTA